MAPGSRGFFSPARKYDRRQQRIKRWRQPLVTRSDRLRAWFSAVVTDHGFVRLIRPNRHRVSAKLWRSAQPLPRDIAWAARSGIRTIVNLRGGREFGCWPLEKEACEKHGIRLVDLPLYGTRVPTKEAIRWAREVFDTIEYPALIHCKSGADRAGLGAALYLLLHEKKSLEEATAQLHPRFGHFRWRATGILDAFFDNYARDAATSAAPGSELAFLEWLERTYDPAALASSFAPTSPIARLAQRWERQRARRPRPSPAAET
jgi:protein tyrosine phosphatase (PTP) superfamily phosphohydrolase (DUF442 family)